MEPDRRMLNIDETGLPKRLGSATATTYSPAGNPLKLNLPLLSGRKSVSISASSTYRRPQAAPLRCFISYSVRNERFVERLDTDLHRRDVRCWYFRKHALWGENLIEEISSEIMGYLQAAVYVFSKDTQSEWLTGS
jgi:hypothetical protein